jgi:hypothetical protein
MTQQIKSQIKEYRDEFEGMKNRKVRPVTLQARLEKYAEIKQMAVIYKDALSFNISDIDVEIASLEKEVKELMTL